MIPWLRLRSRQTSKARRPRRTRLAVERLEDRLTPSSFVVTDTSDSLSDTGSLRHALVRANADTRVNDVFTITFDPSLAGQTITLASTLELTNTTAGLSVVIDGSAAPGLTIAGGGAGSGFSIFTIDAHVAADLANLTLAQGSATGDGGAVLNRQGTVTIDNCVLTGNSATGGGAIANIRGTVTAQASTFSSDSATVLGGAIENNMGTVTVQGCTLDGNTAGSDGGAIFNVGTLEVTDATLAGNTATGGDGGGIENFVGVLTIVNVTFNGNAANGAGGAIGNEGTLTAQCATVSGNTASGNGGGIENAGTLSLQNSIVAANSANGIGDDIDGNITTDLGNNLLGTNVDAGGAAGDVFSDMPSLAPLGSYGGAMQTMPVLPTSPALGAGNAAAVGLPTTDENGGARSVLGSLDIGAYQTQADPFLVTTTSDSDGLAGQLTLREAIALANVFAGAGTPANITFASSLQGATITLTQGVLELRGAASKGTAAISITGQSRLTLSGNSTSGVLQIDTGVTAVVTGLTITAGDAATGGGILNDGSVTVSGCTFTGDAASGDGGAINSTGTLTVSDCTFRSNTASGNGGALAGNGTLAVNQCSFSGNAASGNGGAIEAYANWSVLGSALSGNTASGSGGGIAGTGTGTLVSSTIGGNTASAGGGVENDGTLTIQDSTIGANTATDGGGINNTATLTVNTSTISGNTVGDMGGGISTGGTLTLQNTILSGNSATNGSPDLNGTITTDLGSNLLGTAVYSGPAPPTDIVTDTPGVAPLGSYGGVLQTMPLLPNSKAHNTGNARAAGLPTADEVGTPRTTSGRLDIGAYQLHTNALVVTTQADPGGGAGQVSLREAVNLANAYAAGGNSASITFAPSLQWATITLTQGVLELSGIAPRGGTTITITGVPGLTLSGGGASGVLQIDSGVTAIVSGLTITAGNAASGGGVLNNGTLTVTGCTLDGNAASGDGGAIDSNGTLTVSNCTLTGNAASGNGGAVASSGITTIQSSTISGNAASDSGGGIASTFKLTVQNTILSGNSAAIGSPDFSGVLTSDLGNNLLGSAVYSGSAPRSDILTDTPGLAPLGNYGGGLQTMALLPTSKALGAGNLYARGRPTTDERGFSRTAAGRLDIGAFQTQVNPFVVTTSADPGGMPGQLALREALNLAEAYTAAGRAAGITFAAGVKGATVTLTQGTLHLTGAPLGGAVITIDGGHTITVSGNGASAVFEIDAGVSAVLTGMAITHGSSGIQNNGTLTVQSCTLTGNTANGGIQNTGTLTVLNGTLSGNSASGDGGGIANSGTLTVESCTISGNTASAGGGIANTGSLTLQNSIVSANTASGTSPDILGGITTDAGNNLLGTALQTGTSPSSDIFTDTPGLAALANYGGGLSTMALLPGSFALGAGSAAGAPTTDERGTLRRRDVHYKPVVDIGAFESSGFAISVFSGSGQSAHVGQAFARPLTVIVTARNPLEPVAGGVVWFTAQTGSTGQSATLSSAVATISGRKAVVSTTANGIAGMYTVTASTGTSSAVFQLRNM